mgnify:CR=1 FL=1
MHNLIFESFPQQLESTQHRSAAIYEDFPFKDTFGDFQCADVISRLLSPVNTQGYFDATILSLGNILKQACQIETLSTIEDILAVYIWWVTINQVFLPAGSKSFTIIKANEIRPASSSAPCIYALGKRHWADWIVYPTRGRHVAVSFAESYDAAVTRATQEKKVCPIRAGIIISLYCLVTFRPSKFMKTVIAASIPLDQSCRIVSEHLPYFHQWLKHIRTNSFWWLESRQNSTAPKKRFSVYTDIVWKERCNFMGKPLLIPNPLK